MDWSMPGFPALHYIPEFLVILLVPPVCSNRLFETPLLVWWTIEWLLGFPGGSMVKYPPASAGDAGDVGLIPGMERSPEGGNGNPLQYSCLGNPMGRGAWWATVHGIIKSWTQLSNWARTHTHTHTHTPQKEKKERKFEIKSGLNFLLYHLLKYDLRQVT